MQKKLFYFYFLFAFSYKQTQTTDCKLITYHITHDILTHNHTDIDLTPILLLVEAVFKSRTSKESQLGLIK